MTRNISYLLIGFLMFYQKAIAGFTQADIPLQHPYKEARSQTGVAKITCLTTDRGTINGTGNLIYLEDADLQGRVLITCSHVLKDFAAGYVSFIDENNQVQCSQIQNVYLNPSYLEAEQTRYDVAFLLLASAIDVEQYTPLPLNYTSANDSLIGEELSSFGCSSCFGKLNSNVVLMDDKMKLRRKLDLIVAKNESEHTVHAEALYTPAHPYPNGVIVIYKPTPMYINHFIPIPGFEENFLVGQEETKDLDKGQVIKDWHKYLEDNSPCSKPYQLGDYFITFYRPLPLLSGRGYFGDSGGAWVNKNNEIIALNAALDRSASNKLALVNLNGETETTASSLSEDLDFSALKEQWLAKNMELATISQPTDMTAYFDEAEKTLKKHTTQKLFNHTTVGWYGVPLAPNATWIKETLSAIKEDIFSSH